MLSSLLTRLASKLPSYTIPAEDGSPYLSRYFILRRSWLPNRFPFTSFPSVFLHYFHQGDKDPELHNHPWYWSLSLILIGGYWEERRTGRGIISKVFGPGSFNIVRHTDFHRVELLKPNEGAWTLFLAGFGGRVPEDDWGFWDRQTNEYVPWRVFIARRETRIYKNKKRYVTCKEWLGHPAGTECWMSFNSDCEPVLEFEDGSSVVASGHYALFKTGNQLDPTEDVRDGEILSEMFEALGIPAA